MTPTEKPRLLSKLIVGALIFVVLVAGVLFWRFSSQQSADGYTQNQVTNESVESSLYGSDTPHSQQPKTAAKSASLKIKSLPVELAAYDATTQKAGDFLFAKAKLGEFDRPFMPYGFEIPASSVGAAKKNPQPTFIVPLGTKVRSIVDGVVVQIPQLYSDDFSIMVGDTLNAQTLYETEHVIKPIVKVGDKVEAGQVIAEVSDYDSKNMPGYGLVEMGILQGGNPPQHICPFTELDPSVKDKITQQLKTLYQDWESYRANTKLYDEANEPIIGCLSLDKIEG